MKKLKLNKQPRPKSPRFSRPSGSKSLSTASLNPRAKSAWISRSLNRKLDLLDGIIIVALVISLFIRFWQVKDFNFAFTFDQARDMLEIRPMAYFQDIKLTGPTTSINGLLLGPFYYYFNLPAFWLGWGNPQVLTNWNILWFLIVGIIFYLVLKKTNKAFAFFVSLFYLLSPQLFVITSYFWNANAAVYIAGLYFLSLFLYLQKDSLKNTLFLALFAALTMQFEAAFGVVCVGYAFLIVFLSKKLPQIKTFLFTGLPFFIPQVLFEITHGFQMTNYFINAFQPNSVLGVKTPFAEVAGMHYKAIIDMLEGQLWLPYGYGLYLGIGSLGLMLYKSSTRKLALYFLGFLIFAFIFYLAFYHHQLKVWYLQGLRVWYLIIWGMGLTIIFELLKKIKVLPIRIILFIILFSFLARNFYLVLLDKYNVIMRTQQSNDPKNAGNMLTAIDWVYATNANDESFEAYSYVPEVYEYPYQYLYWWRGIRKYDFTPEVASYSLTDVPIYLNKPEIFIKTQGGGKTEKIAIIYEELSTYQDWLNQFEGYCVIQKQQFPWRVTAEWREKC